MTNLISKLKSIIFQKLISLLCLLLCSSISIIAQEPEPVLPALIPIPKTMEFTGNPFTIVQGTPICFPMNLKELPFIAP